MMRLKLKRVYKPPDHGDGARRDNAALSRILFLTGQTAFMDGGRHLR